MADVDFPAWAWGWVAAGGVAAGLLAIAFYVDSWRRDLPADGSTPRQTRLHGRAIAWWLLGVMTFVLAEVFESDPLTWAAFAFFLVGYISLAKRDAYGRAAQHAKAWSVFGLATVVAYGAMVAYRAGNVVWLWALAVAAGVLALLAYRIARRGADADARR